VSYAIRTRATIGRNVATTGGADRNIAWGSTVGGGFQNVVRAALYSIILYFFFYRDGVQHNIHTYDIKYECIYIYIYIYCARDKSHNADGKKKKENTSALHTHTPRSTVMDVFVEPKGISDEIMYSGAGR
jgi:hypothetical protein